MAKASTAHLSPPAVAALKLDDDARIAYINTPRWISYTLAKTTLQRLEDVLVLPPSRRMRNLLLVGETNNGKTMLLERFAERHRPKDNPGGDHIVAPVVMVESPPVPDEARLYSNILEYLFAPFKYNDRVDKKGSQVLRLLHDVQCRMLILDDINNLLAGNIGRQQVFLNVLRTLGNALKIPIVTAGTPDAFRVLHTDPQLANRFDPIYLPLWTIDVDLQRLLMSFEQQLPLKRPSNLIEPNRTATLLSKSEGHLGDLAELLMKCAVEAVTSGSEAITDKIIGAIDWIAPSDRRKVSELHKIASKKKKSSRKSEDAARTTPTSRAAKPKSPGRPRPVRRPGKARTSKRRRA